MVVQSNEPAYAVGQLIQNLSPPSRNGRSRRLAGSRPDEDPVDVEDVGPTWVATLRRNGDSTIELQGVLRPWDTSYAHSHILVLDGDVPIRWLTIVGSPPSVEELASEFNRAPIEPDFDWRGVAPLPTTAIVICTRNRPASLERCIASLIPTLDEGVSLLVVDNAPSSDATSRVVDNFARRDPRIRYLMEPIAGLSIARNLALESCTSDVVAFTDDDVIADTNWLGPLRAAFALDADVCVALGLVPTAELESINQHYFDRRLPWSANLKQLRLSMENPGPYDLAFPYCAGQFGAGANMAVRREAVLGLGGFDEALGVGTPAGGGEDLELFVRVLRAGKKIAYEPASIIWHMHSKDQSMLNDRTFRYGSGMTAYLSSLLLQRGQRWLLIRSAPDAVRFAARSRTVEFGTPMARSLLFRELRGMLWGPVGYVVGKRRLKGSVR